MALSNLEAKTILVTDGYVDARSDGVCSLIEAIEAANTNTVIDNCVAGDDLDDGGDIIGLPANAQFVLTNVQYTVPGSDLGSGPVGLPQITSRIDIRGNGAIILRDVNSPAFRLLHVSRTGDLTLNNLKLENGSLLTSPQSG
ncbi:MAG: hypothetical protein AAF485_32270, partial [Chloroflexota bacterium]